MIKYKKALFVFRRDLRGEDNTGLNAACSASQSVVPYFFIDPRQAGEHPYRSLRALQFLIESLTDLYDQLDGNISFVEGVVEQELEKIFKIEQCDAVFLNKDYTPFSLDRDNKVEAVCKKAGIAFHSFDDVLLVSPHEALKDNGQPYTVFTPFYKKMVHREPKAPQFTNFEKKLTVNKKIAKKQIADFFPLQGKVVNEIVGGRINAKKKLSWAVKNLADYEKKRDFLIEPTSMLAAYLKFGCLSVREVYEALSQAYGKGSVLVRQLYWRDFFTTIAFHFPHVFGRSFNERYDRVKWSDDNKKFERWCTGTTGFPIVDASMRQLNQTGYMHNRGRMIVASFLTKDLHIDWRLGERYFATKLIDYDPAVNNGSWQWAASTGCDSQPYFRVFNPWLQQKKFDKHAEFIKQWVPELRSVSPEKIHTLFKLKDITPAGYHKPIVDHSLESKVAVARFKQVL